MCVVDELFDKNRQWAERIKADDPAFFENLSSQQNPEFLWIGCADSRVPANQIVDLAPGELFVHRNVANVVVHTDFNCLSVVQYAVEVLGVRHIMVVGHYGCGGVRAALEGKGSGLIRSWLRHVRDVYDKHESHLASLPSEQARVDRLCELNVIEQVLHVSQTSTVHDAWQRGQSLSVHGWVYSLEDGLLRDLGVCVSSAAEMDAKYPQAVGG